MHFVKSIRNEAPNYSSHEGMSMDTIIRLLSELGCTEIVEISEEDYNNATRAI